MMARLLYCAFVVFVCQVFAEKDTLRIQELEAKFEKDVHDFKTHMTAELERQRQEFRQEIISLKEERAQLSKPGRKSRSDPPISTYVFSVYGCTQDTISLDCPGDQNIAIISANYSKFSTPCGALDCCNPHPTDDCGASMESSFPSDWTLLTQSCNYNNNCTFVNNGVALEGCGLPTASEYAIVYYECLPLAEVKAIGFTARDESGVDRVYNRDEIIVFNSVLTNVGNNYQNDTSTFICPVDGMYSFSVGLHNVQDEFTSQNFEVDLMMEGQHLVMVFINYEDNHQSTGNVVVECLKGYRVWSQCNVNLGCEIRNVGGYYFNYFTGYLIHAY